MLRNYLKVALRALIRNKGFSLINILGLAVGMACSILIILWVHHELTFDRFHTRSDRIVRVVRLDAENPSDGIARAGAPWGPALQKDYPEVESSVRFRYYRRTLMSTGDKRLFDDEGLYADSTFFDIFSFELLEGDARTALSEPTSIVLTQSLAKKYFGEKNPVGELMTLDKESRRVTGVLQDVPENSHFRFSFLMPFSSYSLWDLDEWDVSNFYVYLLLRSKDDIKPLEAKMPDFVARHLDAEEASEGLVSLQPLTDIHLHSNLQREFQANGDIAYVYLFSVVAAFIVLIACINFMNLTTAKAAKRAREIGIRKAMGSARSQLIRQFLGESLLLSFVALAIAVVLVELTLPYFSNMAGMTLTLASGSGALIRFGLLALALVVGVLAGAYPAFYLSGFRPVSILKGESVPGTGRPGLRKVLVVMQFAISVAIILSTIIVKDQLDFIRQKRLGFDKEHVVVIRTAGSSLNPDSRPFRDAILQNPNVLSAAASSNLPGGSDWGMPYYFLGDAGEEKQSMRTLVVDENFVKTMKMEIVAGRDFSEKIVTDADEAILVNGKAVATYGLQPGQRIRRVHGEDKNGNTVWHNGHIVGVVRDFNFRSLHEEILPMVLFIQPDWMRYLNVRLNAAQMPETLRFMEQTWDGFESERPFDYFFLDEEFDGLYRSEARLSKIFAGFSFLAIFIACLGLFGLAAFVAEQRTKEIGIRKVLGASVSNIVLHLSKDFARWVLLANLIAWPLGFWLMNDWLAKFAYRIEIGWWMFALAGSMTLLVALVTVSTQAFRAALANPVESLRCE